MPGSINLRIEGQDEVLNPAAFINAVRYFWGMLRDLDSALSKGEKGAIKWEIESLTKNSPAVVAFRGSSLTDRDTLVKIEDTCIGGLRELSEGKRLPYYSDSAIRNALRLARLHSPNKRSGLRLIQVFSDSHQVDLGPHTVEGIQSLTEFSYESVGSVVGNLDSISVHRGNEFRVWEELEARPVTCRFPPAILEQAKQALGNRVLVSGNVRSNSHGQHTSVLVHGIELYPEDSELPTIEQMSGIVDDFTGGISLGDYIEEVRSG
ncbi:MAG: hypothetical protein OXE17_15640 [Chloroflexi bacterium]|nr:hypothetical protein [Chloroflexota bacterium]